MKNYILSLLVICIFQYSEYAIADNILSKKTFWSFYKNMAFSPVYDLTGENFVFFLGSDTVINGKIYNNVLYKKVLYWDNFELLPTLFSNAALREDGSKVYHYDYDLRTERLMFDFSLNVGDTVRTYASFVVEDVGDSIFLEKNAIKLHYLKMKNLVTNCDDFWIEKVGSSSVGIFFDNWWCSAGIIKELICCSENNIPLYQNLDRKNCLVEEQEQTFIGILSLVSDSLSSCCRWILQVESDKQYTLMRNGMYLMCNWDLDHQNYLNGDTVMIRGFRSVYYKQDSILSDLEIINIKNIGNLNVQKYTGTLVCIPYLASKNSPMSEFVMGLSCNDERYILSKNGWLEDSLNMDGILYVKGDSVEIEGILSTVTDSLGNTYSELEIISIKKIISNAQEVDYLEEGKEWTIQSGVGVGEVWSYTELVSDKVERYGHLWKRLLTDSQEFLLYRQEGKKIWAFYPYNDGLIDTVPFLMFDFGLEKGDTAHLYVDTIQHIDDAWIVEDVFDSVFEQGQAARRCQSVYLMENPEEKDIWVEGLGSLANGLTYSPSRYLRRPSMLVCVQRATGENLYHKYNICKMPIHFAYDYSVQKWSVLCREAQNTHRTQWLYFKETGEQQWNRAYLSTKEDFSDERPYGWYYQEMLQVYFKESENDPAELLYDFGLRKGESVLGRSNVLWTADTVYRVEIDGVERICQQMVSNKGDSDTWIEGLGSLKTGFLPADFCGNSMELLCVQADVWWHRGYMYHNAKYSSCHIEETDIRETSAHDVEVHYNAQQKELVIGNDSWIDVLEVVDAQGRCVLRVIEPGQRVPVVRLPQGLYVYRLWGNGIICSGKFVR